MTTTISTEVALPPGYALGTGVPAADHYRRLRSAAGLSAKSAEAAALGLPSTVFGVVVRHGGELVGMGRVVGDGGLFLLVVDIAVEPAHQGKGLGKAIMAALMAHLRATAPATAHVTLVADGEAHRLYAQYGFKPTAPEAIGMTLRL